MVKDADINRRLREIADGVKNKHLDADSYARMLVLAELKYPPEVAKEMIGDELLKRSTFYKETLEEGLLKGEEKGVAIGREEGILSTLAARFGSVSDQLSRRIRTIRERNASLLGDLIKLAATVKDIGEFERKLDEMR